MRSLAEPPDEVEVEFGVKMSVETGAIIAKSSAEGRISRSISHLEKAPRAGLTYDDFDLQIERAGEKYRVRLLNAPTGQAAESSSFPFPTWELGNFLQCIGQVRREHAANRRPQLQAAKEFGGRLFSSFSGEMIAQLCGNMEQSLGADHGLRPPAFNRRAELADLPWEFLYDASQNHFLTTSSETPVVRFLDLPQKIAPLRATLPLRVLVVIAGRAI